ncbi:Tail Collar [Seminavis robusta]|uniref:Tail Collar n=1 Tax=Seminavis robusta TaxID=568900 RepID=A0A9N8HF52_9STRA|nr:Tail Collar [Seminavis robusta]|eukprot:Sro551_g164880.1 Tail Collar (216) ;mRNA; f:29838-30485
MSEPFIGQVVLFAGNFAPRSWAFCNGQLLAISQNSALFSILGTTYGGDGRTTFALPDLRGRVPVSQGTGPGLPPISLGQRRGSNTATLTVNNMPAHNHGATGSLADKQACSKAGTTKSLKYQPGPANEGSCQLRYELQPVGRETCYFDSASDVLTVVADHATDTGLCDHILGELVSDTVAITITNSGGNQAFSIEQPVLGMNYIIATQGIFPSRN